MTCEWCGSRNHASEKCPTLNLVKYLTGEEIDNSVPLPTLIVTKEKNLIDTVEEAHALMHINKRGLGRRRRG